MKKTLVVVDIQREYTAADRPFYIHGIAHSLQNAARILQLARHAGWEIFHVRHLQKGNIFSEGSEHSKFVEGFEPIFGEKEFVKSDYSCFSSSTFASALEQQRDSDIIVIGYGSSMCCLSTIIEGYHRGYKMTFVYDASNAKAKSFDEDSTHKHMTDAISSFSKVTSTDEFIHTSESGGGWSLEL